MLYCPLHCVVVELLVSDTALHSLFFALDLMSPRCLSLRPRVSRPPQLRSEACHVSQHVHHPVLPSTLTVLTSCVHPNTSLRHLMTFPSLPTRLYLTSNLCRSGPVTARLLNAMPLGQTQEAVVRTGQEELKAAGALLFFCVVLCCAELHLHLAHILKRRDIHQSCNDLTL